MLLDEVSLPGQNTPKGGKSKGGGKGKQGKSKGKGSAARRFFRPHRKGGGKGKKSGKNGGLAAKANIAEEEVEEEEIEDDALLADKKKRKRKLQAKKKGKAQPAGSAAHEAEAAVDEDGFAYSAVSFRYDIISSGPEWCLKGAKGVQEEVEDGTSMILDTGCTKAMCSRHAYLLMRQGLSEDRVELPDSSTFNFANGQKALARGKCRIWFSYEPPLFTDFSIIDEGKVPFLMSLPQMKNLGVSLDLRGTPEKILFHTDFLKGQLHQKVTERNKPEVKGAEEQGAEPAAAVPPLVPPVPAEGAPVPPLPQEGEEVAVLPQGELNLDGLVPPPLVKLHQRLSKRTELLKLRLKHYHMSTAQFRRRTGELYR